MIFISSNQKNTTEQIKKKRKFHQAVLVKCNEPEHLKMRETKSPKLNQNVKIQEKTRTKLNWTGRELKNQKSRVMET